jgi:Ca2+-binding EF-hand superfamily protein
MQGNNESNRQVWDKIIAEVDQDGDGEIDFTEFRHMMNRLAHDKNDHKDSSH